MLKKNEKSKENRGDGFKFASYDANYVHGGEAITARTQDPLASDVLRKGSGEFLGR